MQKLKSRRIAFILAVFIAILLIPADSYASEKAKDIKYSADKGKKVEFNNSDFNKVCKALEGESLKYVKFDLPSSSKGVLWYDYKGKDEEEVDDTDKYYYDGDDKLIDNVTFVPKSSYSGTVTIGYEGKDADGNDFTGEVKISIGSDDEDAKDITFSIDSDETAEFDGDHFDDVCQDVNDKDLDYVKFSLPSSSKGVLYYKYHGGDYDSKVSDSTKYYNGKSPSIDDVTFVPEDDYSGTVSVSYKGYDEDGGSFSGTVKITVDEGDSVSGDIKYKGEADEEIDFDEDDFNKFCKDENKESLNYVTFDIPSSSKGVLWYDYDGKNEEKIKKDTKYYYDKEPSIDDISFIPNDDFSGSCKIDFEGYDKDGDDIDGTVVIDVSNEDLVANTIYLTGTAGSPVIMFDEYFNKKCRDVLDSTLDYVKFQLPGASSGTLYYNYTSAGNYSSLVSASTKYYYDDDSPALKKVAFVSAGKSAGTYTVKYTGYDEDGSSFTGDVNITLTAGTGTPGSGSGSISIYYSDVCGDYSWAVKYVDTLYSTSVISGSTASDGTKRFNPGTAITRGDFMLYLVKALNLYSPSASGNFSDVAAGSYYYDAIGTAKALGIAQGADNKFYPNSTITREDAMALALRAMNISGNAVSSGSVSDLYSYPDNGSVSAYAKEAVAALIKAGIVTGSSDGKIYPKSTITRAESVAMIYRIKY